MIRRKKVKRLASNSPTLAFAKSRPRRLVKRDREVDEHQYYIAHVRTLVFERAPGCEYCLGPGDEMDETYQRCKTARMPPAFRFSTAWCVRGCRGCHQKRHSGRFVARFTSLRGAQDGSVLLLPKNDLPMPHLFTPEEVWRAVTGR